MEIEGVVCNIELNSRKEPTISYSVKTPKGKFTTLAPEGKSTGKHEAKPWRGNVLKDVKFLNNYVLVGREIKDLYEIHRISSSIKNKIGANSRFAFEATLLKALAAEHNKELWNFLNPNAKRMPMPLGNTVGGGLHTLSMTGEKPEFQEFLFVNKNSKDNKISFEEAVKLNERAYLLVKSYLRKDDKKFYSETNDEGAWKTTLSNEQVLGIMKKVAQHLKIEVGVDVAASSFYRKGVYNYRTAQLNKQAQEYYINSLIDKFQIFYIEDPMHEEDFNGFSRIGIGNNECLVVGDDLTVTNHELLKKAVKNRSIDGIIIKPNQQGSIFDVMKTVVYAKEHKIKIIVSHRSGETTDTTIADLAMAWQADYIKTGIQGVERTEKLNRLIEIEKSLKDKVKK